MQSGRGNRRGVNLTIRVTEDERAALEAGARADRFRAIGPWMVHRAITGALPARAGNARPGGAVPELRHCPAAATSGHCLAGAAMPELLVLDLCGGSGSWSRPYAEAGYRVELVTLPGGDVRSYVPPPGVHGVLAAPPCTEFSLAKNGHERDLLTGLETVTACLRIIALARPRWWALENPTGLLGRWLGRPRDVFQPCDFGDPWTKRTALWGDFALPARAPVLPLSGMRGSDAAERAVTPPSFARAFFAANP